MSFLGDIFNVESGGGVILGDLVVVVDGVT